MVFNIILLGQSLEATNQRGCLQTPLPGKHRNMTDKASLIADLEP